MDKDQGDNAQLRYSLISTKDATHFDINRGNGVVTAAPSLAESPQTAFSITVQVRDSGFPQSLTTEEKFNVYVAKEFDDDVPGKSLNRFYTLFTNSSSGSAVIKVNS